MITDDGDNTVGSLGSDDEPIQHAVTDGQGISIGMIAARNPAILNDKQPKTHIQLKQK